MGEGRVKFFNAEQGFGMIETDTNSDGFFVDREALTKAGLTELKSGQRVIIETGIHHRSRETAVTTIKVV